MTIDDGGPAFGGKATAWKVIGNDDKALEIGRALAREGGLKSLVMSEEDFKRVEQLTLDLPSMSLRDWFAGKAMQGILQNPGKLLKAGKPIAEDSSRNPLAETAYEVADAMITRKRETEKG